jgi:hypothetical protein
MRRTESRCNLSSDKDNVLLTPQDESLESLLGRCGDEEESTPKGNSFGWSLLSPGSPRVLHARYFRERKNVELARENKEMQVGGTSYVR